MERKEITKFLTKKVQIYRHNVFHHSLDTDCIAPTLVMYDCDILQSWLFFAQWSYWWITQSGQRHVICWLGGLYSENCVQGCKTVALCQQPRVVFSSLQTQFSTIHECTKPTCKFVNNLDWLRCPLGNNKFAFL